MKGWTTSAWVGREGRVLLRHGPTLWLADYLADMTHRELLISVTEIPAYKPPGWLREHLQPRSLATQSLPPNQPIRRLLLPERSQS